MVISKKDPGVTNWVSTGGLNQGTIAIRFQDLADNGSPPRIADSQNAGGAIRRMAASFFPDDERLRRYGKNGQTSSRCARPASTSAGRPTRSRRLFHAVNTPQPCCEIALGVYRTPHQSALRRSARIAAMGRDRRHGTLVGRRREQQIVAELLEDARQGRSGVLVIRGEAGIGKTALLTEVLALAAGVHVLQIVGAESEMELAYAGVQQLCAPLLGFVDQLPEPQKGAPHRLGDSATATPPTAYWWGSGVLTLLGEAGAERPIVCVVDDAQWVDSASLQALAFVARRILADPVVMIFAARDEGADRELSGQPELVLRGLDDHDARTLLAAMVPGRLNERVRENIIAEAGGNPLALLELHTALTPEELAGGYGLANAKSLTARIERTFGRRLRELPSQTSTLLLIAAAEPAGRPEWLWAAAQRLGIGVEAATAAEAAGLVTLDSEIRFRHPLIRAAIYRSASLSERRRVHAALAQAIAGPAADDHRAWHRAHATDVPDEHIAAELERWAEWVSRPRWRRSGSGVPPHTRPT